MANKRNKNKGSYRNPQDMIDETYNARDYKILEKDLEAMNAYVMPLDMVKDVDYIDSRKFYEDGWHKELKRIKDDSLS